MSVDQMTKPSHRQVRVVAALMLEHDISPARLNDHCERAYGQPFYMLTREQVAKVIRAIRAGELTGVLS